jgi:hypothetical protein
VASAASSAQAAAAGTSTVNGIGSAMAGAVAASAGTSTVQAVGGSTAGGLAASVGTSTVQAIGATGGIVTEAAAAAAGTSTVQGLSRTLGTGAASAAGAASVNGVSGATAGSVGQASGVGTATAIGRDALAPEVPEGGQGGGIAVFPTPPKRRPVPKKILPVVKRKIRGRGGVYFGVAVLQGAGQVAPSAREDPFGLELDFEAFGDFDLEIT